MALAALAAWTFPRLEVQSDITHFLPAGDDRELAELSRELTSSDLNRTITLTIEAPDSTRAAAAASAMAEKLAEVRRGRVGAQPVPTRSSSARSTSSTFRAGSAWSMASFDDSWIGAQPSIA